MTERVKGFLVGEVSNIEDPLDQGRVQVILVSRPGEPTSQWAPIARPLASGGFGLFWQPVVGDMVLLGFEEGAIERPYVVGSIFTGDNAPPTAELTQRLIQSETGHQIMLDDTSGSESITITDAGGSTIVMDSAGVTIESSADLAIKAANIAIEASGEFTAKGSPIHLNP